MAEKLNPFYKLVKTEVPINITSELKEEFDSVKKALSDACGLALKQHIPGKQLILMTDASFRSAEFALMIEDNPDQKIQSKRKPYKPVAFGSKFFSPAQLKMFLYSKKTWQFTWDFLSWHTFSGKQQIQQLSSQTANPLHIFSKRRHFCQHYGMHVIICCNLASK